MFYLCASIIATDKITFVSIARIPRDTKTNSRTDMFPPRRCCCCFFYSSCSGFHRVNTSDDFGTFFTVKQKHTKHLPVFTSRAAIPVGGPLLVTAALIGQGAVNQRCLYQTLLARWNFPGYSTFTGYCRRPADYFRNRERRKGHCQLRGI